MLLVIVVFVFVVFKLLFLQELAYEIMPIVFLC